MSNILGRLPRKALFLSVVAASYGGTVNAQEQRFSAEEELVVTGIRASLDRAMDVKRNSVGVVDAISAEDIGKFPDTNLAESLQRVTGVSIDRANNEGNQVTVRGWGPSFNLVTLNGRQMPTSSVLLEDGITRSFNFREIAAESVTGVEVFKTGKAHTTSGGIGATIDIATARPFDYDGFTAAGSFKGIYDTSVEKGDSLTPEISGMISHTFNDDMFGVLLALSHSERNSRSEVVGTQGWVPNLGTADVSNIDISKNPDQTYWAPFTVDADTRDHERTRQNGQLVLQYAPIDAVTATLDYTMSRYDEQIEMNRTSFWFDAPSGTADANGTVTDPFNANDELNFWAWDFVNKKENDSFGLNVSWDATDSLSLELDIHNSTSHSNPDGEFSETIANLKNPRDENGVGYVDVGAIFGSDDVPSVIIDASDLPGGDPYDKDWIVSDLFQKRGYEIENTIQQIQLDGIWSNESDGFLKTIRFGAAQTDYQIDTYRNFNFNFVDVDLDELDIRFNPRGDFGDQFSGASGLFPYLADYRATDFIDLVGELNLVPPTINNVNEETLAAYVTADMAFEVADLPVELSLGARYEETDVESESVQNAIVAMNYWHPVELRPVFTEEATSQTLNGSYSNVLPNLDLSVHFLDDLIGRFSFSKTISRADITAMFPSTEVNARPGELYAANQGSPNLLPYESTNFDLSLEWYYADSSYASVGYFRKDVENFIGATTVSQPLPDADGNALTDPSVNPRAGCPDSTTEPYNPACLGQAGDPVIMWDVAKPANSDESATVDGWELNVQHVFGESGFGVIANMTLVDGDIDYDVYSTESVLALTGLSDSANLIAFYERDQFEIRLAYNWRDEFLLKIGQPQVSGEPTFTEEYGQWDLNASYDINDYVSVFAEGINLTNETARRHGRFSEQLVSAEQYGPRYNLGVRAKF